MGLVFGLAEWGSKAHSAALSLDSYLHTYLAQSEDLKIARSNVKSSEADVRIARDIWAAQFQLEPKVTHTDQDLTSLSSGTRSKFYERQTSVDGKWIQSLPLGIDLEFNGNKNLEDLDPTFQYEEYRYSGSLIFPLWRNAFGSADRNDIHNSESLRTAAQNRFEVELLGQCLKGIDLYLQAYNQLGKARVSREKFETAREALKIAEHAYGRRLIREVDVLSARVEFLDAESELEALLRDEEVSLKELELNAPDLMLNTTGSSPVQLAVPEWPKEEFPNEPDFASYPELKAAQRAAEAAEWAMKSEQNRRRLKVDLGVTAGQSKGRAVQKEFYSYTNEFFGFFLRMEWPFNHTDRAQIEKTSEESFRQRQEVQKIDKALKLQWAEAKGDLRVSEAQLKLSNEKIKHDEKRRKRAFELLRGGRIQYDEYLRYSQSYFAASMRQIELETSVFGQAMTLMQLTGRLPRFCEDQL
ncbi:MAG: TolC family protein [Bdellovibrionales bacterium]|nr:TolC family protein [Bdellovibrionales bacterium]